MELKVCIGSSCHLKGSRQVVEQLQQLIAQYELADSIDLTGTFCMNNCQKGVSVVWKDQCYSLDENSTLSFFNEELLPIKQDN